MTATAADKPKLIVQILQTFTYYIKNRSKSCESRERSPSNRFTGKSEQNIANTKPFSLESTDDLTVRHPHIVRGLVAQCTLVKSGAVQSG